MSAIAGRVLILPKGDFDASVKYEFLDLVNHNSSSWLAKKASQGIEPSDTNTEFWQRFGAAVSIATEESVGTVRPDGETITIDENGVISSVGGTAEKVTYENESVADVTNVKEALDGIFDGTQLEQWSATKYTGYTTEEVVSIYNNLHVNASDSMYYRARVEHRAPFSVLGSGDYYVEGFRLVDTYGTQEAIRYTGAYEGNVIMKFYRTLTNGVWGEWQRTFTDVGGTVGNGTSDSPFGIKGKDHAFMEFSNKDSYIFGRIGFNAGKELTMYDTDWVGYKILHEGNKPSGTYTGNGSATSRTIDIGGNSTMLLIHTGGVRVFVNAEGAAYIQRDNYDDRNGKIGWFPPSEINFVNGVLTIASADSRVNYAGLDYLYISLL